MPATGAASAPAGGGMTCWPGTRTPRRWWPRPRNACAVRGCITKCCTEVCPADIKITENAIALMEERSADQRYDPLGRVRPSGGPPAAPATVAPAGIRKAWRQNAAPDADPPGDARRARGKEERR